MALRPSNDKAIHAHEHVTCGTCGRATLIRCQECGEVYPHGELGYQDESGWHVGERPPKPATLTAAEEELRRCEAQEEAARGQWETAASAALTARQRAEHNGQRIVTSFGDITYLNAGEIEQLDDATTAAWERYRMVGEATSAARQHVRAEVNAARRVAALPPENCAHVRAVL
jgi:hypothetical protein